MIRHLNFNKWVLYPTLFFISLLFVLIVLSLVLALCGFFLQIIIPSIVIHFLGATIFLAISIFLIVFAKKKKWDWLKSMAWGAATGIYFLLILGILSLFFKPGQKPNQKQPFISLSGKYTLTIPIEKEKFKTSSGIGRLPYWHVTISDAHGNVLYKDLDEEFIGTLNIYWFWDKEDRVWLYNSDNSGVYFWERNGNTWSKYKWGYERTKKIDRDLQPPEEIYPPYANKADWFIVFKSSINRDV